MLVNEVVGYLRKIGTAKRDVEGQNTGKVSRGEAARSDEVLTLLVGEGGARSAPGSETALAHESFNTRHISAFVRMPVNTPRYQARKRSLFE